MVGAFPRKREVGFAGGQLTMANEMMESSIPQRFEIVTLDSTQRTVPAPSLPVRALIGLGRFLKFVWLVAHPRIGAVVVVTADAASLIEKTVMLRVARLFGCGTASWPVADLLPAARASKFWHWWTTRLGRWSDVIVCQGPSVAARFEEFFDAGPEQCAVVPNFVDTSFWSTGADGERRRDGVFAGWISREKGVVELVRAIGSSDRLRSSHFYLCGGGPAEAEVAQLIEELSLRDSVTMTGWVARDELRDLLQRSEVFVLPSYIEGFPMSVIEAMAAGAAVVTTPVGAVPDYLADGVNSILVEPRSAEQLKIGLERVFDDDSLRARLRAGGRSLVESTFSLETAAAELEAVLERTLSSGRRGR
jgi:glycosyltransferase involved in cell wall biosynthesis